MQKKLIAVALCLLALAACKKKEEPAPEPAPTATQAAPAPAPEPAPKTATPQPTVTLAAGAPIPAQGVALWLAADDAQPGKLASWTNYAVAGVTAKADTPEQQPEVVAHAGRRSLGCCVELGCGGCATLSIPRCDRRLATYG